jgi:hypothetical protein
MSDKRKFKNFFLYIPEEGKSLILRYSGGVGRGGGGCGGDNDDCDDDDKVTYLVFYVYNMCMRKYKF